MQNCLVTGGAGFIGSHLCKTLLSDGYKVICLDNLITGSKKNIESLLSNPNFEFLEANVCEPIINSSFLTLNYMFHLASPASPIDYQNLPEETLLVNSQGTLNVLNLAKNIKARVLIASTSEIYGDPLEHPQKEDYWGNANSFGLRSCYDESKRFAEAATYVFLKKYGIDARIIRIFNTYGPNMQKDDGRVVSNFINWALKGETIKIDGDGSQTRSFCYVTDLVDGIKKAMFVEGTKGEIFNLGNPEEYKIKELAEKIIELTNSKSKLVLSDTFRPDDPMQRCPDITKARDFLNWEPKVKLEEGLQKTIDYYKNV
ncbi:MAG: NAD-dependent epimerase/dehydratase [Candidatus Woesebacteria bacterium GW2011_GWA1_33_30]|uniref:UDP-glucuronate decarboxylase n=1 Tax=Candidatus Woesebacteria bacterium GW2011_GWA2_33_28 TaxID=1618561 RepID=A0A0G0CW67_9BACT|nr:MAG: NAD-dependent epimerase/dehydratase [Candidatus Woesebacteria bacterium GW2011_GWA2_33_28]KKP48472.1 MAG: NAD-dependent epimerase/dehydratase [Candidatus Woesebacteria bacterium GW2011_GWA1_33_30]KKP49608.1 MAG: NAD-dependent epimerase/dehydratase [Microgenomates group bacterium GW2011_GWC1_33_32]KKP52225.1 MAG: NAD-dependent epimerase/dehydratase [Candidatus Woesebacteria bacterium GW2011_GWB1_33_38]KKP55879.1 MAG: NAD-dependent epimerase/dehydratase [Microgenomates group bacterium GW2